MNTKTLKIPESVHKELKVYIAKTGENMTDFSGSAIIDKLKLKGHKFVLPTNKTRK